MWINYINSPGYQGHSYHLLPTPKLVFNALNDCYKELLSFVVSPLIRGNSLSVSTISRASSQRSYFCPMEHSRTNPPALLCCNSSQSWRQQNYFHRSFLLWTKEPQILKCPSLCFQLWSDLSRKQQGESDDFHKLSSKLLKHWFFFLKNHIVSSIWSCDQLQLFLN